MELTAGKFYDERVERCKQGISLSFKELYVQYAKAMYNTCLRIVNHSADAEDIVQEAFIEAFRNIGGFNYQSTFGAWMKRIVINRSINYLRNKKLRLVDMGQASLEEPDTVTVDEEEINFRVQEVKKAVTLLPDGYRTVFSLNAFEGYDHDEIAGILGITASTARTQYHRARKQLLNTLKKEV